MSIPTIIVLLITFCSLASFCCSSGLIEEGSNEDLLALDCDLIDFKADNYIENDDKFLFDKDLFEDDEEGPPLKRRRGKHDDARSNIKDERKYKIIRELDAILKCQRGENEKFSFRRYTILNWPENINPHKRFWTLSEIKVIKSRMGNYRFELKGKDKTISQSPNSPETLRYPNDLLVELQNETFEELQAACKLQNPSGDCSDLYVFDIENWLDGVPKLKVYWDESVCVRIRADMNKFIFVPDNNGGKGKMLGSITRHILDRNLSSDEVYLMLLERFKVEAQKPNAKSINWTRLDRSAIHKKFDHIPLNYETLRWVRVFQNHEIIDNIHFI